MVSTPPWVPLGAETAVAAWWEVVAAWVDAWVAALWEAVAALWHNGGPPGGAAFGWVWVWG